ncbi:anthranilate synthase component 1 [Microbacterium terrae]|uniref:Anthranilate synthase component 1 n=1 Tax=Microbacterium terrae TaxID=69369 RepID=A0A0M2HN01_9MICO|nr:anthranilate synthase component I family protein [Microbacterium terrae]KJL45838.1 Anthranilate synthase component 1 [Microbacterium terrae]MBP1077260.1 anthranilate synthase component 1 [Microbacterium terrae]GLJ98871.1 hypothetical protein GCM10017594_20680 [Microbacterium terrae]
MSDPRVAVALPHWVDPASVFSALFAGEEHAFWLDAGPDAQSGWSWMGAGAPDPTGPGAVRLHGGAHALPGGFDGGWVGWLGYEQAAARAGAPIAEDPHDVPQQRWLRTATFVAFDHGSGRVWTIGTPDEAVRLAESAGSAPAHALPRALPSPSATASARHTADEYAGLIAHCRAAIREGDAYQLCLTTRFEVPGVHDPLAAYLRLRAATPAHHGGFIRSGEWALASASPERFLEVAEGVVRTHPIKGTRPRGADESTDAALARELLASEKERAENVMIVDLMRNDLSKVCRSGTVSVDRLLEVESYPAVHQLVSAVSGSLRTGVTLDDLLAAAFPAGSMTGAPKLSAMTILHRLEASPRGVFAGCFGWVGDGGALDLAMVIRSAVVGPQSAHVGAGGGITWHSDPGAEVAEVGVKARGPLAALGAMLPPGW